MMEMFKLSEVANITTGYPFRGRIKPSSKSEVLVLQMKDISGDLEVDWSSCVKADLVGKKKPEWLINGDILLAARGNRNYALYVGEKIEGYKAVAAPHFFLIRNTNNQILPEFLAWYLNQTTAQKYFELNAEGSAAKSLRRVVVENLEISIPSETEQHKAIEIAKNIKHQNQLAKQLIENNLKLERFVAKEIADANLNKHLKHKG